MTSKLDVREMIPFISAKDFESAIQFCQELFDVNWRNDRLCQIQAGSSKFLIQDFYEPDYAKNCMYQLMVDDVDHIWEQLQTSGVLSRHGDVRAVPLGTGRRVVAHYATQRNRDEPVYRRG